MSLLRIRLQLFCLLCGAIFLPAYNLHADGNDIQFRHISLEDGLSQSTANCIIQDRKGFIWIGTEDGLNKYDGYTFKVYKPVLHDSTSISNNSIWSLYEDSLGILWIGTYEGLNSFDPKTEKFKRYQADPNDSTSLSHKFVRVIYEDRSGILWIGTFGGGLCKFDRETEKFIHYHHVPDDPASISNNTIISMYEDHFGILWIGTNDGLNTFDRKGEKFMWYKNNPRDPRSLSNSTVNAIFEDHTGVLWIGTGDGLSKFKRTTGKFARYKNIPNDPNSLCHNDVRAICEDKGGVVWIGTDNGLNKFNRESETFIQYKHDPNDPHSLTKNGVRSIYEDRSGVIWIGNWATGINLFEREKKKFEHYKNLPHTSNCLSYNFVLPLYEDKEGMLWVGTYGGGLNKIDRKAGRFTHYRHNPRNPKSISHDRVRSICEDQSGVLWIGTWGGGLNKFDRKTEIFIHFKHDPDDSNSIGADILRSLFIDSYGVLWIGTEGGGVNRFDRESGKFTRYAHDPNNPNSISNNRIFAIIESKTGDLWISTFGGGINKFDRKNEKFIHYTHDPNNSNSLSHDYIMGLYEDKTGILWIGTDGKGLNRFDPEKEIFTLYNEEHGLSNTVIYALLEDSRGNLWMSHNKGLSQFNPKTEAFRNYTPRDGIQSNEFNGLSCFKNPRTGEMFFGGVNGFNAFHPDSIRDNPYLPQVAITDFQLFNKSVPIGEMPDGRSVLEKSITETKQITLLFNDNVFSFEFVALHYVSPGQNKYAYMMEGLEKDWNYVGSRRYVTYTGLPPGNYIFRVKGSNNDGVWSEEGASVKITVIPPFWKTWWFYTLCVIVIVVSAALIYRYRVNQLKKQKEEEVRQKAFANFSQVLEQGSAAVYRRNFDSNSYEYMSESIKDITGYNPEEFTLPFWDKIVISSEIIGDIADLSLEEVYQRVREGKVNSWILDSQIRTKSGDIRWIRDMQTALRDESGQCSACLGIVFDITDRKLVEQKLAHTTEELGLKNQEMETDLNMAREIQTAFLAKHYPYFPHEGTEKQSAFQFYHLYLPASSLAGDFFDILPISDHKVGILTCDVMGHGARASLLTFYLRGLIEEIMPIAVDAGTFMKRLNDGLNSLIDRFYTGIFATAFYCVADIKSGQIHYTNAGHPIPFIQRRSRKIVEKLDSNGRKPDPAIGIHKDCTYSVYESSLADDDVVFLYTDGLYEVENSEGKMYGKARLFNSLRKKFSMPPNQLLDRMLREVNTFADSKELKDDVCLVAMHVKHILS